MSKSALKIKDARILTNTGLKIRVKETGSSSRALKLNKPTVNPLVNISEHNTQADNRASDNTPKYNRPLSIETIDLLEEYLTINKQRIIDIKALSMKHTQEEILNLLTELAKDKKETLKDFIALDITNEGLDITVSEWFRLIMTINIIKTKENANAQQTTTRGL